MSAESEFETWFPRGDRVGPAGVPVRYRARRGERPHMNPFSGRARDEEFKAWLATRGAARDARTGPFEARFPFGDITTDHRFAAMRIDQAKSWVIGDTNGFAPQHPADIVADLLVLLEAYQQAADQVEARA
jgi:hypothetical protein